jgi:hypothetical protein
MFSRKEPVEGLSEPIRFIDGYVWDFYPDGEVTPGYGFGIYFRLVFHYQFNFVKHPKPWRSGRDRWIKQIAKKHKVLKMHWTTPWKEGILYLRLRRMPNEN